jgi:hypothetical protein
MVTEAAKFNLHVTNMERMQSAVLARMQEQALREQLHRSERH